MTFVSVGCGLLLECFPVPKQKTFMGSGAYRERWRERERVVMSKLFACIFISIERERERRNCPPSTKCYDCRVCQIYVLYNICAVWRTVQHSHKFISILVFELIYDALTYVDPPMFTLVVFAEP